MGEILKGATLIEFDPPSVEVADLRIDGDRIAARGASLSPQPGDEVTSVRDKFIAPGLVVAHTHLYSYLARGMPPLTPPPVNFLDIQQRFWWRYDRSLDLPSVELAATVGALDALASGTTTVFDHHASSGAVEGSLFAVKKGVDRVGLRAVLGYEVSDRNGPAARDRAMRENESFLVAGQGGRFRALVGAHAAFTLEDATLDGLRTLAERYRVGVHLHVAEDRVDEVDARKRGFPGVVARLVHHGVLGPNAIAVHAVHLAWEELARVQSTGAWLVHCPRSNMGNFEIYAPAQKFGARAALGTDGIGADLFAEAQVAYFRSLEAAAGLDILKWIAGGHRLASQVFGAPLGRLREGALADLVLLDYAAPTPVTAENLTSHVVYGLSSGAVDAVMVDGVWRSWAKMPLTVERDELLRGARAAAPAIWARMTAAA